MNDNNIYNTPKSELLGGNLSENKYSQLACSLEEEQNFIAALFLGFLSVLILGSLWGMFGYLAELDVNFVIVLVSPVIGYVVRESGKGIHFRFGILAALLSLSVFIFGNMMIGAVEGAIYYETTPWEAFVSQSIFERLARYYNHMNISDVGLMIVGMAISIKFAFRKLSKLQREAISHGKYTS